MRFKPVALVILACVVVLCVSSCCGPNCVSKAEFEAYKAAIKEDGDSLTAWAQRTQEWMEAMVLFVEGLEVQIRECCGGPDTDPPAPPPDPCPHGCEWE